MARNMNPARITDPMWRLWEERPNKDWKLGGIFADKKGYHNTVQANLRLWPTNYSIRLPLDTVKYNLDKARAIDLTMPGPEMRKVTKYLKDSALDPRDNRLAAVREFYGTLDSITVYGLSKTDEDGPWHSSSADRTHLWHVHMSIFTAYINNWEMLAPINSVLAGQSLEEWRRVNSTMGRFDYPRLYDTGEVIRNLQMMHNKVRNMVSPPCAELATDGDYGKATQAAFYDFWKKRGGKPTDNYKGEYVTAWLMYQYQMLFAMAVAPKPEIINPEPVSEANLRIYVADWLNKNISTFGVKGVIQGKVTIDEN